MKDKRSLLVDETQKALFRMYKAYRVVGSEIKEDFFGLKDVMHIKDGRYVFHMSSQKTDEGLLSQAYGLFLMASITDRFDVRYSAEELKYFKNSIMALVDYADRNGFDVSPFSTPERNRELFGKNDAFIESLTWVLSCLLYARRLHKAGKVDFEKELPALVKLIARSFKLLLDNVIHKDGSLGYVKNSTDYLGWGSVTRCTQISLYFTHSVCESFGDLEDTALGNADLDIDRDEEFIGQINTEAGEDIIGQFITVCDCVGANMYNQYKSLLGKNFFYTDGSVASFSQISCSIQSPVLLNHLYVVLSAIYTNYYKELEKKSQDEYKDFMVTVKNAVDMVYETYIDLKNAGKSSIVDRDIVMFSEKHPNKDICKYLAAERINVSILEALTVKAKNMIVTYVSKYPEKEIDTVIDIIEDNHMNDKWIWSEMGFDLQQTERCISAIREFYDYYDIYIRKYAEIDADEKLVKKDHRNEIAKMQQAFEEEKKQHEKMIRELKKENAERLVKEIQAARDDNHVDSAVIKLIDKMLNERIAVTMTDLFLKIFDDSKESAFNTLTQEQSAFKDAFKKILFSFMIPKAQTVKNGYSMKGEWSTDDILRGIENDFGEFLQNWMEYLTRENNSDDVKYKGLIDMLTGNNKGGKI